MPKKPLMKAMAPEKRIPRTQARMVEQGIVGSSLLSTTLRTSAYGEFVVMRAAWIFISEICCSCFSGWSKMPSLSKPMLVRKAELLNGDLDRGLLRKSSILSITSKGKLGSLLCSL